MAGRSAFIRCCFAKRRAAHRLLLISTSGDISRFFRPIRLTGQSLYAGEASHSLCRAFHLGRAAWQRAAKVAQALFTPKPPRRICSTAWPISPVPPPLCGWHTKGAPPKSRPGLKAPDCSDGLSSLHHKPNHKKYCEQMLNPFQTIPSKEPAMQPYITRRHSLPKNSAPTAWPCVCRARAAPQQRHRFPLPPRRLFPLSERLSRAGSRYRARWRQRQQHALSAAAKTRCAKLGMAFATAPKPQGRHFGFDEARNISEWPAEIQAAITNKKQLLPCGGNIPSTTAR